MACRLDVRKAILDQIFKEMFDGRYTFTRISDDTIRINNTADSSKTKAKKNTQAIEIAKQKLKEVVKSFKNAIRGYISQESPYDPVTIKFTVDPAYIEYEYQKLPEDQKTDPLDKQPFSESKTTSTKYVDHMTKNGKKETYRVEGSKIYNEKGNEVFPNNQNEKNKIFASLALKEKRAVVVDYNRRKFIVNNRDQVMDGLTGEILRPDRFSRLINDILNAKNNKYEPFQQETERPTADRINITDAEIGDIYNAKAVKDVDFYTFLTKARYMINTLKNVPSMTKEDILESLKCL